MVTGLVADKRFEPRPNKNPTRVDGPQKEIVVYHDQQSFNDYRITSEGAQFADGLRSDCACPCITVLEVNPVAYKFPFPISVKIVVTLHVESMAV